MKLRFCLAALILTASAFAADPALLNLVPADSTVIAGINIDRTASSPLGQYIISQLGEGELRSLRNLEDATGFDPRRDLREVLMASSDRKNADGTSTHGNGLVLLRGNFDIPRVLDHATKSGATITNYKDASIVSTGGSREHWVAMLPAGLAIAGPADQVRAALDRRNQPSALSPSTLTQVNDLSTRYDVFMLTNAVPSQIVGLPQPGQGRGNSNLNPQILQSIEQISGGLTFGANVVIAAEATTRSDRDAVALADVLRFLASMAQMNRDRPEAAQFAGLLDTLELNTRANVTTVRLSVPQSRIEDLIRQKKGVRKASYVH